MGNSNSSNNHSYHNDIETTATHKTNNKVPKHLQPLKRKQTKKSSSNNNNGVTTTTITNNNELKKLDNCLAGLDNTFNNQPLINPVKTLQTNYRHNDSLNQIFLDHSASSPQLFRWTKGRRFQNSDDVSYPLPNDQTELDRHRVQFYIIRWAFESRHIVPPMVKQKLFEGIRVLDVGCGPGLWLGHPIIDMAQDFQKSTFDAIDVCNLLPHNQNIDINPSTIIQCDTDDAKNNNNNTTQFHRLSSPPQQQNQQDNFKFTVHNTVKDGPVPFEAETFDYVQQALTVLAYTIEDWKKILLDLKRVTKPGGHIQLIEVDLYPQPLGEHGGLWRDQIIRYVKSERGMEPRIACQLEHLLTEIGLIEVETRFVSVPIGSWGLDIGNLWEQNLDAFFEAARPFLVDIMQISNSQYKKDRKKMKDELKDGRVKAFNNIYIAYGRVPF